MRLRELVETPIGETEGRRPATIGFAAPRPGSTRSSIGLILSGSASRCTHSLFKCRLGARLRYPRAKPLRKLLLPSVPAVLASTVLTAPAGSIAHTIEPATATASATPAGWRLSGIGGLRSAVALDGTLHARQTLAQVIGSHDRHQLDLGVQAKEQPLGGIGDLR